MIDVLVDEGLMEDGSVDDHPLPGPEAIRQAVLAALAIAGFHIDEGSKNEPELCIRFAANADIQALNRQWRDQDKVTDVLSFPLQEGPNFDLSLALGDIALAVPFIFDEAARLGLPEKDHCLHLIVHACLHLVGYDHISDADAAIMQPLERRALQQLGLHDPYPKDAPLNIKEETL